MVSRSTTRRSAGLRRRSNRRSSRSRTIRVAWPIAGRWRRCWCGGRWSRPARRSWSRCYGTDLQSQRGIPDDGHPPGGPAAARAAPRGVLQRQIWRCAGPIGRVDRAAGRPPGGQRRPAGGAGRRARHPDGGEPGHGAPKCTRYIGPSSKPARSRSGYTTPAQLLVAKALLDRVPNPSEAEVREALSSVLDRETGYVKPVQAVLRAAAVLRGEDVPPFEPLERAIPVPEAFFEYPNAPDGSPSREGGLHIQMQTRPLVVAPAGGHAAQSGRQAGAEGRRGQAGAGPGGLHRRFRDEGHALRCPADQPARPRPHHAHRCHGGAGAARRPRCIDP